MVTSSSRRACWAAVLVLTGSLGLLPGFTTTSAAGAGPSADACGTKLVKPSGETWTCTFVDDFAGDTVDRTKWVTLDTSVAGFTMAGTCFQGDKGYSISGGNLRLTVTREAPFTCANPYGDTTARYLGGGISTFGRFSQAYGRFEVRMKFPKYDGPGLHGGFWMNPQNRDYGIWPGSGEIDVAEWYSNTADHAYPSLHYTGSIGLLDTGWNCVIGRPDVFHKFVVIWSPVSIDFYYDGQLCFSRQWTPLDLAAPAPFDKPFTIALVAAAGGGLNNSPTPNTPFPATTVIDYAKAWR